MKFGLQINSFTWPGGAVSANVHGRGLAFGPFVSDVERIAVTRGPGLIGALLVGVHDAKGLRLGQKKLPDCEHDSGSRQPPDPAGVCKNATHWTNRASL